MFLICILINTAIALPKNFCVFWIISDSYHILHLVISKGLWPILLSLTIGCLFFTISADSRIRRCFLNKKLHYIVYPFLSTHFLMGNTLFNTFPNKHWASDRHAAHVYIGSVGPGAILDIYSTFMVGHPNCGPSLNVDM